MRHVFHNLFLVIYVLKLMIFKYKLLRPSILSLHAKVYQNFITFNGCQVLLVSLEILHVQYLKMNA